MSIEEKIYSILSIFIFNLKVETNNILNVLEMTETDLISSRISSTEVRANIRYSSSLATGLMIFTIN